MNAASTWNEERANALSHGLGAILSAAGLILLIMQSVKTGSLLHACGSIAFGGSLVVLYVCSTLLHSSSDEKSMIRYEMLDHAAIYILIAGTYTPFLLLLRNQTLGLAMLGIVWLLAMVGVSMKLAFPGRFMTFSIGQYLAMAWLVVLIIRPLQLVLPHKGMFWLLLGVLLYSIGSIFYFWRTVRYHHTVWHLFVVAGSVCHFICVYGYVLPLLA
ncbi:hemolysin III family protein [Paenibacillus sp. H1-7]|uniref:PAQR family membrane homeostasis protein TrhA n=1 Tax=Paenibacillus sp. H1-7 TaxID=2282849 RepID=UPI001EF8AD60|nr:hemolysin III family protein [Paenibacillus sp. H1-7]ULL15816.1 hemolysin III family protein [Paenibacillus sp. H1-7]